MSPAQALCPACDEHLDHIRPGRCLRCQQTRGPVCAPCRKTRSPLDACVAEAWLEGDVARWIHRFKYPARGLAGLDPAPLAVARQLAVEASCRAPGPLPDLVVPVPLHPRRLRRRSFNPAALLAQAVAGRHGVAWDPVALRRTRDTPSQTGLDRRERRRNVRRAFEVRSRARLPPHVWLVDDVVTTASTLEEAARTLRRSGARHVQAICAARTP